MFNVGSTNQDAKLLAYADEAGKAKDSGLRNAALELYSSLVKAFPEACKGINTLRADPDAFVAHRATSNLAKTRKCAAFYDQLLDNLAALPLNKDLGQHVGFALEALCSDKAASPAQKERGAALSRRISDAADVEVNTRYYTLSAVIKCDPQEGPAYLEKFKNDKNKTLASRAKSLAP